MASNTQTVPKVLQNLRDNAKAVLQCGNLTYKSSNTEKMTMTSTLTEEEYTEAYRLIIHDKDQNSQNNDVLRYFEKSGFKFFQSALRIKRDNRLKVFRFLDTVDDRLLAMAVQDPLTTNFVEDCLSSVQLTTMEWLSPMSNIENYKILEEIENKPLSDVELREETIVNNALLLLQRIYRMEALSTVGESLPKFDPIIMDKVVNLFYMGHKRQRTPAILLMNQVMEGEMVPRMKIKCPDLYGRYKKNVQSHYSARMMLLVKGCDPHWSSLWSISIRILGTDLHRGAALINKLLSVEERAFKSTETMVRREAFVSWKLLIDNLALDMKELATQRRIRLLCVPLTANNSKSEMIALKKLEVWWYLIAKLYSNIVPFTDPVVTQFLNFCFGPLGDTPLLSTKFDVIASPGKRFYKAKIIAIDCLLQLIVVNQRDRKMLPPILEERLPSSISELLFNQCYKAILHSVAEAVIIISKLGPSEMKNREDICKVLWVNLMHHIRTTNTESKTTVYNELILVITELQARSLEMPFVNDLLRDVIVPELAAVANELIYYDRTLMDLMTKVMVPTFLRSLQGKQCDAIKCLMWQTVRPETLTNYHPETLRFLQATLQELRSIPVDTDSLTDCFELWFAYAEIAYKFMRALQDINEGTATEPNFKTIESIISFPFTHMYWTNSIQAQKIAVHWKDVYKKYECQADTIPNVKPNEIFNTTSKMIANCVEKNKKCHRIAVYCLDALMATINYKFMLAQNNIPPIIHLVSDLTSIALHEGQPAETECALKALSSLLITVYGHSPKKVISYLSVTSQTVELMLKADADGTLVKEIASTWETIVSILRGLSNLLDENFLRSYKQVISLSMGHPNAEISSLTLGFLEQKDNVRESAKAVLHEFAQEFKKSSGKDPTKMKADKSKRTPKSTRIVGSFLNRKIQSPRIINNRGKEEVEKKLPSVPLPEPDSQDYVVIKSDINLDVNRLTEHQKELLKRRRDDIPALYNDLSQSSSQDTQDLQNWFASNKKSNEATPKPANEDAKPSIVEEKSVIDKQTEKLVDKGEDRVIGDSTVIDATLESNESKEKLEEIADTQDILTSAQDTNSETCTSGESQTFKEVSKSCVSRSKETTTEMTESKKDSIPVSDDSYVSDTKSPEADAPPNDETNSLIAKKLNFESREEYPEEKDRKQDDNSVSALAPSSKTNRGRRIGKAAVATLADDKNIQGTATRGALKTRGGKLNGAEEEAKNCEEMSTGTVEKSKGATSIKTKGGNTTRLQTDTNPVERGVKRKVSMDTENTEGVEREKKRRKSSRSPSSSQDIGEMVASSQMDKRTEHEISRLRIDMVIDGPLTSRRRSKYTEDFVSSEVLGKKSYSPNAKATRGKAVRSRTSTNSQRNLKSTDGQEVVKRRRGRIPKVVEAENVEVKKREDESQTSKPVRGRGRRKKVVQEIAVASESQTIIDDDETMDDYSSPIREDEKATAVAKSSIETSIIPEEEAALLDSPSRTAVEIAETPMDVNDLDEVVESSQDVTVLAGSCKRSMEKIMKLKSIEDTEVAADVPIEAAVETGKPTASSPILSPDVPLATGKNDPVEDKIVPTGEKVPSEDPDETFLDISAIRPQLADDVPVEETEKKAPETSKTTMSPVSLKAPEGNSSFSSPKGNATKRFAKPKVFASQGRAAHMLGLVTKLATLEKEGHVDKTQVDEEIAMIKRMRTRESEGEIGASKRMTVSRESERIGSPSGSRQEKIFNNMKAADYAASPPGKLFGNLKNNGEKISPKMEKSQAINHETKDDEASLTSEKDELPMLEWSSANPPSLTASPSASILKRNLSIVSTEMEVDPTASNRQPRKRVSFADPPVSKEMAYEIETAGSPHKITKYSAFRGLLGRKDSPIRSKQSRFMMIQIDNDKTERQEEAPNLSCDVDVNCERENELLIKMAEDLEAAASVSSSEATDYPESSLPESSAMNDTAESKTSESESLMETLDNLEQDKKELVEDSSSRVNNVRIEETATQDDLFNSSDEKFDSPKRSSDRSIDISKEEFNVSGQSSIADSFKLNVTDDSVIGSVTDKKGAEESNTPESLDDTMDARNMTNLIPAENSAEAFDGLPVRTSTQSPDSNGDMDTLPVTDSLLGSFPMTMDSQVSSQADVEIPQPELLNSTDAIYPNLEECNKPIEDIIDNLTNPLWRKNLLKHFEIRCIRTVGDLARLSEREIVRIPVKGSSKIDFVRKVLGKFEQKLLETPDDNGRNNAGPETRKQNTEATKEEETSKDIGKSLADASAPSLIFKLPDDSKIVDVSRFDSQTVKKSVLATRVDHNHRRALGRTSTINSISTIVIDSSTEPEVSEILADTKSISEISTINLSSDTIPTTTKSVGTLTDPPAKPSTKSVESQTKLEELLDEIDVDIVLQSAVKRTSAEKLLTEYKLKMKRSNEMELCKETLRILGISDETLLKFACRESGLKKVLCEIPNIFYNANDQNR